MLTLILAVCAAFFLQVSYCLGRRAGRFQRRAVRALIAAGAGLSVVLGAAFLAAAIVHHWYFHRPRPANERRLLFQGVTYAREVREAPRRMVIHIVTINLDAPGIGFRVTPGGSAAGKPIPARTTSRFLREAGAQVAVNGDCFSPFWSKRPWSYYPREGDPVSVLGNAVSDGVTYHTSSRADLSLYLTRDNRASIGRPLPDAWNVLSGTHLILENGRLAEDLPAIVHPRTAIALDRTGHRLFLIVIDGRQVSYSDGATLAETAAIAREHGAWTALNLDGGGSSALVVAGSGGRPHLLNWPTHTGIPGRERPVANHLAVYALPVHTRP